MKRSWDTQQAHGYAGGSHQNADDGTWVSNLSHPYASAYNNMPNPFPTTLQASMSNPMTPMYGGQNSSRKMDGDDEDDGEDYDDDDDDDLDDDGSGGGKGTPVKGKGGKDKGDSKKKIKLTRGSRACIPCRKIKMRCIPDDANPGGPCKRCKTGGHECVFEESNRGKRSTRKNEALAARVGKMEAALRSIGGALSNLDQPALNSFSTALHSVTSDPDMIQLITSHTSPSVVPTLAVSMNRGGYGGGGGGQDAYGGMGMSYEPPPSRVRGEDAAHQAQPPLSPRLHSLPDNVLSPLGLLAEASLHNSDPAGSKRMGGHGHGNMMGPGGKLHRPSPLSLDNSGTMSAGAGRNGAAMHRTGSYRAATSDVRGGNGDEDDKDARGGVANSNYFKPGQSGMPVGSLNDDRIPELLTIVSREEIGELFEIFFEHISLHVPVLYREFHTPELVVQRSQFLCTVVCAIAARYYPKRTDLRGQLSSYAKRLAFEVPSRGYKSVEVCQAYLLLSVWTLGPEKTFEQDRTWLMLGMAIRMATDLNLHRKSVVSGLETDEGKARDLEIINRERTWLLCFILDRSISAQMGKPYTLREDYIIRNACEASWHQQRFSLSTDMALAAYVVLQQIMSRAIDSIYSSTQTISGLRQDCDYMLIVRSAHEELRRWLTEWNKSDPNGDPRLDYDSRAQFYFSYSSLVLYSFGLENALERAKMDISFFLTNVYEAATRVCTLVKDDFTARQYLPYLPDTNFVMCSYALLSLLKLLKPELRPYHDSEEAIFKLVTEVADILEDCAIDSSHQPAIYAAFIREIVRKTKEGRRGPSQMVSRVGSPVHQNGATLGPGQDQMNMGAPTNTSIGAALAGGSNNHVPPVPGHPNAMYDPSLMDANQWNTAGEMLNEGPHFTFIPQGGDMMILPSAAGPSESMQNSPSASFLPNFNNYTAHQVPTVNSTPQTTGWAEYLPTFMSSDGFDGWDGSMLLPGFGRGQITLGGGLLHSQFGSGIITPAQHTPTQSRVQSRAQSPIMGKPE